jgi:hypothetical protein
VRVLRQICYSQVISTIIQTIAVTVIHKAIEYANHCMVEHSCVSVHRRTDVVATVMVTPRER